MSLVHRCATYQHIRGPQIVSTAGTLPILAAALVVDVAPAPAPDLAAVVPDLAAAPDLAAVPDLAAAPTPAPEPLRLTERPQDDLDLFARGIAKAIAAATANGLGQSGHR
jgi:hypothetical protein